MMVESSSRSSPGMAVIPTIAASPVPRCTGLLDEGDVWPSPGPAPGPSW